MSDRTTATPVEQYTEQYLALPEAARTRIDTAFLMSEGGDILAAMADGEFGPVWRQTLQEYQAAKVKEIHDRR